MNRARGAGPLKIKNKKISADSINTDANPSWVCLDTAYFAETEKLLLKVLQINVKVSRNSTISL